MQENNAIKWSVIAALINDYIDKLLWFLVFHVYTDSLWEKGWGREYTLLSNTQVQLQGLLVKYSSHAKFQ